MCVSVCDIKSEYQQKTHVSDLSKLDILLHKTHIKVPRLDMLKSIISLSKIAHQMWRDHHSAKETRQQKERLYVVKKNYM